MEGGPSRAYVCSIPPTRRDQRTYDQLVVVVPANAELPLAVAVHRSGG